jgi:transcriptional regulator with XRE-family HTH domain
MIGDRIKKAREKAGFTQDEFCLKINKSKRTLLNYEKNESEPSVNTAILIAEICNIDKIWLLTGEEIKTPNINYKNEIINNLELLDENQIKYVYHIIEAEKVKKNL